MDSFAARGDFPFRVQIHYVGVFPGQDQDNTICFDSAEGRDYTWQVCTHLVNGGWSNVTSLSGTGTEALLSDPDEDKPEAFYRVQVELSE